MQVIAATVGRILNALNQAFAFQPVGGSGHGTACQQYLFADGVDGQGAFMQQSLQDAEVAEIEAGAGDTLSIDPLNGLGRATHHQPYVCS